MAIDPLSNNDEQGGALSKNDILDALQDDGDSTADALTSGKEKEDEGETLQNKGEIELEENPEGEGDGLDTISLVAPFRKAEIEKDFPGIFKKYGYLERSYYRDRKFTEVFASPEDAQEAADTIETFDRIQQELLSGSTRELFVRIREESPQAFHRIVDTLLFTLSELDLQAHNNLVGGVVKNLITMLARKGKMEENDEFRKAALIINRTVFESDTFEPYKPLTEGKVDTNIEDKEQKFTAQRLETVKEDLQTRVDDIILATIKKHIDPTDIIPEYVRKHAIKDALVELNQLIENDRSFAKQLDKLWQKAIRDDFSKDSVKSIRDGYLSKAKSIITPVVRKARNEALKGIGKRVRDAGDSDTQTSEQPERPYYKGSNRGSSTSQPRGQKKDIPRGMKTLDYLNSD